MIFTQIQVIIVAAHYPASRIASILPRRLCSRGRKCLIYLSVFFSVTPSFKPPLATFDFEESLGATVGPVGNTAKAKKGKKTKKGYVF